MTGFEPRYSGIGSDYPDSSATATAHEAGYSICVVSSK